MSDWKRPMAWLLLQLDLVVFLLSRNLRKTCTMKLVPRALHRAVADEMARVSIIETEAIVTTMLAFCFGEWLELSTVDLHRGMGIDLHHSMGVTGMTK